MIVLLDMKQPVVFVEKDLWINNLYCSLSDHKMKKKGKCITHKAKKIGSENGSWEKVQKMIIFQKCIYVTKCSKKFCVPLCLYPTPDQFKQPSHPPLSQSCRRKFSEWKGWLIVKFKYLFEWGSKVKMEVPIKVPGTNPSIKNWVSGIDLKVYKIIL